MVAVWSCRCWRRTAAVMVAVAQAYCAWMPASLITLALAT
jgi:hypothetical protein